MTDFFGRLAGRTLGSMPVVEPLVGSRYGAGPEVQVAEMPAVPQVTTPPRQTREETLSQSKPAAKPVNAEQHSNQKLSAPPHTLEPSEPLAPRSPAPLAHAAPVPIERQEPGPVEHPATEETRARQPLIENAQVIVNRPSAPDHLVSSVERNAGAERNVPSVEHHVTTERRIATERTIAIERDVTVDRATSVPLLIPRPAPSEPDRRAFTIPFAEKPPEQPPRINVTIGRIEVRAVPPPQPAPPHKPKPMPEPKISLDEYLRSFNRGSR